METGTMCGGSASPKPGDSPGPCSRCSCSPPRCHSPISSILHPWAGSSCGWVTLTGQLDPQHVGLSKAWKSMSRAFHWDKVVDHNSRASRKPHKGSTSLQTPSCTSQAEWSLGSPLSCLAPPASPLLPLTDNTAAAALCSAFPFPHLQPFPPHTMAPHTTFPSSLINAQAFALLPPP